MSLFLLCVNLPILNMLTIIGIVVDMVFHAVNPLCRLKKRRRHFVVLTHFF